MHSHFFDFYDKETKQKLKNHITKNTGRTIRFFIRFFILICFIQIGIVPTDSMYSTIKKNDIVLLTTIKGNLERGDIVSFKIPKENSNGDKKIYLKRIIGLPGEEIEIVEKKIYINGNPLYEEYVYEDPLYTYKKTTIPEGHYFVLGDNRNVSYDSTGFGFIPEKEIRNKALAIISYGNKPNFKLLNKISYKKRD